MEGVTILNTIPAFNSAELTGMLAGCTFAMLIITLIILGNDVPIWIGITSVVLTLLLFISVLITLFIPSQPERYKVSISDDVTFNDFMERYKIVDERGQLFIVEEREIQNEGNG